MRVKQNRVRGSGSVLFNAEALEPRVLLSGLSPVGTTIQGIAGQAIDVGDINGTGSVYVPSGVSVSVDSINEQFLTVGGNLTLSTPGIPYRSRNNLVVALNLNPQPGVTGNVDLTDNNLYVDYGSGTDPISQIQSWLAGGYNSGSWTGSGIVSSNAAGSSGTFTVGYADGSDGVVWGLPAGMIQVMYTINGDANLDGAANGSDLGIVSRNLNDAVSGWDQGDFNYDGIDNGVDFAAVAANFNKNSPVWSAPTYTDPAQYAATFTDDSSTPLAKLSAMVDWGDGSDPTAGAIVADGNGTFHVIANHTYADAGDYDVTTTITDANSNTNTTVSSNAIVSGTPFSAVALDASDVQLTWAAQPILSGGQVLEYSTHSNFWPDSTTIDLAGNVTSYTLSGLSPSTTYYFELMPSAASFPIVGTASATTLPSDGLGGTAGPTAPTISAAATASQPTNTTLQLTMTATSGSDPISYYWQEISGPGGPSPQLTNSEQTTDVILGAAGTYDFRCTATDDATGMAVSSDSGTVTVNQVGTTVNVSPGLVTTYVGNFPTEFAASETDQFGNPLQSSPTFTWSVGDSSLGSINSLGAFRPGITHVGQTIVQALSSDGSTGEVPVFVGGGLLFDSPQYAVGTTLSQIPGISFTAPSGYTPQIVSNFEGIHLLAAGPGRSAQDLTMNFTNPVEIPPAYTFQMYATDQNSFIIGGATVATLNVDTDGSFAGTANVIAGGWPYADANLSAYHDITSIQIQMAGSYSYGLAEVYFVPIAPGVEIGNGTAGQVLQASQNGIQNLVPLYLSVPPGVPNGSQITLSTTAADKVDVWDTENPSTSDTPLLGGSAHTGQTGWIIGNGNPEIPTELYVGATAGSQSVGDIAFTLAVTPPGATTGVSATTQPATADYLEMDANAEPNDPSLFGKDISGKTLDWVVGQEADLQANINGATSYTWTIDGATYSDWTFQDGANGHASPVLLAKNNQATQMGTNDRRVQFFWVKPGTHDVTLTVVVGGQTLKKEATFNVVSPVATLTGSPTNPANNPIQIQANLNKDASGQFIQEFSYGAGGAPGIGFNASAAANNLEGGTIELLQVTSGTYVLTPNGGAPTPHSTNGYIVDDDKNFKAAYSGQTPIAKNNFATLSSNDSPDVPTDPYSKITVTQLFNMYLMYQPDGGKWVPLAVFAWYWAGTATKTAGNWGIANPASPPAGNINGSPTATEPAWTSDFKTWQSANGI
jgi:hypothetical protein